jgi:hypothetical protein
VDDLDEHPEEASYFDLNRRAPDESMDRIFGNIFRPLRATGSLVVVACESCRVARMSYDKPWVNP